MNLTGIDVYVLVSELQHKLIGSWIVNIYQLPSGIFIFKLRKPKEGLLHLLIEPGKRLHLTQFNRIMPKEPSNFCTTLRKHLRDKRVNSIEQRDLDRIIIVNIGPDEGYKVVITTSGAVGIGCQLMNLKTRPTNFNELAALSGIGQSRLLVSL